MATITTLKNRKPPYWASLPLLVMPAALLLFRRAAPSLPARTLARLARDLAGWRVPTRWARTSASLSHRAHSSGDAQWGRFATRFLRRDTAPDCFNFPGGLDPIPVPVCRVIGKRVEVHPKRVLSNLDRTRIGFGYVVGCNVEDGTLRVAVELEGKGHKLGWYSVGRTRLCRWEDHISRADALKLLKRLEPPQK